MNIFRHKKRYTFFTETSTSRNTSGSSDDVEITEGMISKESWELTHYHEVPSYLQDNPHIIKGYRIHLKWHHYPLSIFRVHNQTMNIWTHLSGAIFFVLLSIYSFHFLLPHNIGNNSSFYTIISRWVQKHSLNLIMYNNEDILTRWPIWCFFIGCVLCLSLSTMFHVWVGKSQKMHGYLLRLDLSGICLIICGSNVPIVYYGLYCSDLLRNTYLAITTSISLGAMLLMIFSPIMVDKRYIITRSIIMAAVALSGAIPMTHIVYQLSEMQEWMLYTVAGALIYMIGGFIYALQIPERLYPGLFDHFGHSHSLFHICVVLAAYVHYIAFKSLYAYRVENIC